MSASKTHQRLGVPVARAVSLSGDQQYLLQVHSSHMEESPLIRSSMLPLGLPSLLLPPG